MTDADVESLIDFVLSELDREAMMLRRTITVHGKSKTLLLDLTLDVTTTDLTASETDAVIDDVADALLTALAGLPAGPRLSDLSAKKISA